MRSKYQLWLESLRQCKNVEAEKPPVSDQLTIQVPGDLSDACLLAELERRGYETPRKREAYPLETPRKLSLRLGFNGNWFCKLTGSHPPVETFRTRNGRGRVAEVRSNAAFDAWAKSRRAQTA
jgi:hypothetical protein